MKKRSLGARKARKSYGESNVVEFKDLADPRGYNLLLIAAESGNADVIPKLLQCEIPWKFQGNEKITAQTLAQKGKHSHVILTLLQENLPFPPNLDINECSEELKKFIEMSTEFHEMIKAKNIKKIDEIIDKNSNLKHFYNLSNESAPMTALKLKFTDMYEYLLAKNLCLGPDENKNQIKINSLRKTREKVNQNNQKFANSLSASHISILMDNTKFTLHRKETDARRQKVQNAFQILNEDPLLEVILKAVAISKYFKIDIDFLKDSTYRCDPWVRKGSNIYYGGQIKIGAKELGDQEAKNEILGNLAHELSHFAIFASFQNNAKPYKSNNLKAEKEFGEVIDICEKKKDQDKLIEAVFREYDKSQYAAELIVRPAQLIFLYKDQPEILKQKMEIFRELFDYFAKVVIPAIRIAIANTEAKEAAKSSKKFSDLSEEEQNKIKNSSVLYKKVEVKLNDVIKNDQKVYEKLTAEHILKLLNGVVLNLDDSSAQYLTESITFDWKDLTKSLKKKILNSDASFKGESSKNLTSKARDEKVRDQEAIGFDSSVINEDNLSDSELETQSVIKTYEQFYMERSFIPEDAKMIWFEVTYGHGYKKAFNKSHINFGNGELDKKKVEEFLGKSFDEQCEIFDKIKENEFFKSINFNLNSENFKFMHKSLTDLTDQGEHDRIMILSAEAGAGKSMVIEAMAKAYKEKYKINWVSYIGLKNYVKFLKPNGCPENVQKWLEVILELSSENELERKIFEISFQKDRTMLFWNGFDEISPTYNEFVLNAMKFIHENTRNVQFITTRPLYAEQLSRAFKVRPWTLVPFDDKENREFVEKVLTSQGIKREKIIKKVERIGKLVENFNAKNDISYKLDTPFMLKMVSESHEYISYYDETNLFYIFDGYVEDKLKIWLDMYEKTKDKFKAKELYEKLEKIYQKYALLIFFGSFSCPILNFKLRKLQIMHAEIPQECPVEEITRMGILFINGKNNFEFAHKIFVDFFMLQYFIQNIFHADNTVDSYEAELRIELFFKALKTDKNNLQIILDILGPCLASQYRDGVGNFCSKMSILFRTKFRTFLMHMLEIDKPEVFKVLIYFFKRDHDVLVNLLQLNEPENLYTAIFNPNHSATFIDPEDIKRWARHFLSDAEFQKLLKGKFQKGTILFGMKFFITLKNYGNHVKSYKTYDSDVEKFHEINYWDFINNVKMLLNDDEQKVMFVNSANPKCYLFYDKMFTTFDYNKFWRYWMSYEDLMSRSEMQEAFGNAFSGCLDMLPQKNPNNQLYLSFLMYKAEEFLTPVQIYEVFYKRSILHKAHYDVESLKQLWTFLTYHISPEERRRILLQDNGDDRFIYNYQKSSKSSKNYFHYDLTPFKIFHKSLTTPTAETYDFIVDIYEEYFDDAEIREIILKPSDFLFYVIGVADEKYCRKFAAYLEELFKENERILLEYFERKMRNSNMTAFEMMEDLRGMPHSQQKWFNNLKIMSDLFDKIRGRLNC